MQPKKTVSKDDYVNAVKVIIKYITEELADEICKTYPEATADQVAMMILDMCDQPVIARQLVSPIADALTTIDFIVSVDGVPT